MKSTAIALALLASTSALADDNWVVVANSEMGALYVNESTVVVEQYEESSYRAVGLMVYMGKTGPTPAFMAAIDVAQCVGDGKGVLVTKLEDAETIAYKWTMHGPYMYDKQGTYLCQRAIDDMAKIKPRL